jgi:hypothetical protein
MAQAHVDPTSTAFKPSDVEGELNLVENWLKREPSRWICGALAGLVSMVIAMSLAGFMASSHGLEFSFPIKLFGTILMGSSATQLGAPAGITAGFVILGGLAILLGALYSHFAFTNHIPSLFGVGLTWGAFSWVFIFNLFSPSFRPVYNAHVSPAAAFFVCMTFGICLTSTAFFDAMIRGGKRA